MTLLCLRKDRTSQVGARGSVDVLHPYWFWQCMDNIREKSMLEKLLAEDKSSLEALGALCSGNTRLRKK